VETRNTLDNQFRLAVHCDFRTVFTAVDVIASFRKATGRYGLFVWLLPGNDVMFTDASRRGGRVAPEHELAARNISFGTPGPATRRPAAGRKLPPNPQTLSQRPRRVRSCWARSGGG
jgi:hypothetical protein